MNKRILISTIIAISTLLILVVGATYAYFAVTSTNSFGTRKVYSTLEDQASNVTLEQVESELSLEITRKQMNKNNTGKFYYLSGNVNHKNIAKATANGEGRFSCSYELKIEKSYLQGENIKDTIDVLKSLENKNNNIDLFINGNRYDLANISFPFIYKGELNGITQDTPQYITTNIRVQNTDSNQSNLEGSFVNFYYTISDFKCELKEEIKNAPSFAVYSNSDSSLRFYKNNDVVVEGSEYQGRPVTKLYSNIDEDIMYTSYNNVPWNDLSDVHFDSIIIEDVISPKYTNYWFSYLAYPTNIDLNNLNTSEVLDMSHMFMGLSDETNNALITLNLSSWDTSKVMSMASMFEGAAYYSDVNLNVYGWNTSSVKEMQSMFKNLSKEGPGYSYISGLLSWDVSNVINMNSMFENTAKNTNYHVNIKDWNVTSVISHTNFDTGVEDKIFEPTWKS